MSWTDFLYGLLWGTLVSVGNYFYLRWVVKNKQEDDVTPRESIQAVVNCYMTRFFINVAALFVCYRHMWMVAGTGVGLTVMKNVMAVAQFIRDHQTVKGKVGGGVEKLSFLDVLRGKES